ncbi:hypothetical protein [Azospirillum sp. SYSU D00513]|uniref:hypothetical protein n=1 Tax=Azospirillum sp. SYSU D00513 TaxID=2812561 RepID=UPI001A9592F7|nr:hypothetical protein [Azospirillum sp. SYSU D00513]
MTNDQRLWLATAHPDRWDLKTSPDGEVVELCLRHGLIRPGDRPGELWKLTAAGGEALRELRGPAPLRPRALRYARVRERHDS